MNWTSTMRWLAALPLALLPLSGCTLDDALENAPCNSDDDCLGSYICVRTMTQTASGSAGLCREEAGCAAGVQAGCETFDGTCSSSSLTATCVGELCFCCTPGSEVSEPLATASGPAEALCINCGSVECPPEAPEVCTSAQPRCDVPEGATCGCRVPDDQVENSACADQASCGEGFVCTRTLEQEAEDASAEPFAEDQMIEPGWCRPEDAPECVAGQQEGCRLDGGSCGSGLTERCSGPRCFCCESPDSSNFDVRVYEVVEPDGTSAACVECDRSLCEGGSTCTTAEQSDCVIMDGVCGCTP